MVPFKRNRHTGASYMPLRLGMVFITAVILLDSSNAIQWLVLSRAGSIASIGTPSVCDQLSQTLVSKQVKFCKKHPGFMLSVQTGASRAIDECKFQFRTRRWNCSTLDEIKQSPAVVPLQPDKKRKHVNRDVYLNGTQSDDPFRSSTGKKTPPSSLFRPNAVVPAGTREAAFVHAISAAGVAHALTRACSAGELEDCGCDRSIRGISPEGFEWAGCSDNVHFGTSFSRSFVDAREHSMSRKKPKRKVNDKPVWLALMNLHNNEAGRKIIEKSMRIECKCHGVSGSCELRTCWKAMPSFREIGEQLKDKFDSATEVEPRTSAAGSRRQLMPRSPTHKPHTDTDLVYLDRSPDYCDFNEKTGSLGTRGRTCNKTSRAIDGCELLCCNRGYRSYRERRVERCNCKFQWCCSVHCKTCIRDVEVHVCE